MLKQSEAISTILPDLFYLSFNLSYLLIEYHRQIQPAGKAIEPVGGGAFIERLPA
ncbi:hypothetical protein [Brenneria sp. L3-3Z]|uniref:hypothetical protein n=1 Tax=unclassified Brenneria TaxID=2634434 RepID=UPI0039B47C08